MHGADNFLCRAFYFNNLKGGDFMELNIAVVDDNAASISEVISMMRRFMHEVENITINISKFGSGEKFFKDFSQNAFHAVFLPSLIPSVLSRMNSTLTVARSSLKSSASDGFAI